MPTIHPKKIALWNAMAQAVADETNPGTEEMLIGQGDKPFLRASPKIVLALLAERKERERELCAERQRTLALLRTVEWRGWTMDTDRDVCPACGRVCEDGHAPDCRLDAEIQRLAALLGLPRPA